MRGPVINALHSGHGGLLSFTCSPDALVAMEQLLREFGAKDETAPAQTGVFGKTFRGPKKVCFSMLALYSLCMYSMTFDSRV